MHESIRVRFAPSPTGYLHLGGARTALFNWLFARHKKGKFILRIEDTDRTRSTLEAVRAIHEGLEWLGLDWDEGPVVGGNFGPYHQTERLPIYKEYAERLLKEGKAYLCFCSPEELEEKRKLAEERREAPRYDGKCRKLSAPEIKKLEEEGRPKVIRFLLPPAGRTIVDDLIRGRVEFENDLLDDFVIVKSDGFPTYNFAAVIDDYLMKITHVIRGDDHLSNTPRQILLYEALEFPLPQFAHLPMILGSDRSRLSKRHGATSVIDYRDQGYLPEAMLNYLVRLGWSSGDQEIFSRDELIEKFSLEKVGKTSAVFDLEKLRWLNAHYIRAALLERIAALCIPYLENAYPPAREIAKEVDGLKKIERIVGLHRDRLKTIDEIVGLTDYCFLEKIKYNPAAADKYLKAPGVGILLKELKDKLKKVEPFTKEEIEKTFRGLAEEKGLKAKEVIHPARVALTGRAESPPMFEVAELLGRQTVLKRLEEAPV